MIQHPEAQAFIDPRSGRPTAVITHIPIIPGTGFGNSLTLEDTSTKLNRPVSNIRDEARDLVLLFLTEHPDILAVDSAEFGEVKVSHIIEGRWHTVTRRVKNGIPAPDAGIILNINHGNVVLWGVDNWGDITIELNPSITSEQAVQIAKLTLESMTDEDFTTPSKKECY